MGTPDRAARRRRGPGTDPHRTPRTDARMRRLPLPPALALALAAVAAPALVVLPTVGHPAPAPRAVAPRVVALALHGVDVRALAALPRTAAVAPGLPPAVREALAGDLAANPVPARP